MVNHPPSPGDKKRDDLGHEDKSFILGSAEESLELPDDSAELLSGEDIEQIQAEVKQDSSGLLGADSKEILSDEDLSPSGTPPSRTRWRDDEPPSGQDKTGNVIRLAEDDDWQLGSLPDEGLELEDDQNSRQEPELADNSYLVTPDDDGLHLTPLDDDDDLQLGGLTLSDDDDDLKLGNDQTSKQADVESLQLPDDDDMIELDEESLELGSAEAVIETKRSTPTPSTVPGTYQGKNITLTPVPLRAAAGAPGAPQPNPNVPQQNPNVLHPQHAPQQQNAPQQTPGVPVQLPPALPPAPPGGPGGAPGAPNPQPNHRVLENKPASFMWVPAKFFQWIREKAEKFPTIHAGVKTVGGLAAGAAPTAAVLNYAPAVQSAFATGGTPLALPFVGAALLGYPAGMGVGWELMRNIRGSWLNSSWIVRGYNAAAHELRIGNETNGDALREIQKLFKEYGDKTSRELLNSDDGETDEVKLLRSLYKATGITPSQVPHLGLYGEYYRLFATQFQLVCRRAQAGEAIPGLTPDQLNLLKTYDIASVADEATRKMRREQLIQMAVVLGRLTEETHYKSKAREVDYTVGAAGAVASAFTFNPVPAILAGADIAGRKLRRAYLGSFQHLEFSKTNEICGRGDRPIHAGGINTIFDEEKLLNEQELGDEGKHFLKVIDGFSLSMLKHKYGNAKEFTADAAPHVENYLATLPPYKKVDQKKIDDAQFAFEDAQELCSEKKSEYEESKNEMKTLAGDLSKKDVELTQREDQIAVAVDATQKQFLQNAILRLQDEIKELRKKIDAKSELSLKVVTLKTEYENAKQVLQNAKIVMRDVKRDPGDKQPMGLNAVRNNMEIKKAFANSMQKKFEAYDKVRKGTWAYKEGEKAKEATTHFAKDKALAIGKFALGVGIPAAVGAGVATLVPTFIPPVVHIMGPWYWAGAGAVFGGGWALKQWFTNKFFKSH